MAVNICGELLSHFKNYPSPAVNEMMEEIQFFRNLEPDIRAPKEVV